MTNVTRTPRPSRSALRARARAGLGWPASKVECGYCRATDVPVNPTSGELRRHTRPVAGDRVVCIGSGQRAWIYPGNLRPRDVAQVIGEDTRFEVLDDPQAATGSSVWTFTAHDATDPKSRPRLRSLPGDALLRLWTHQEGER